MYLPPLVPLILRVLTHDGSKDRSVTGTYSLSVDSVSRDGLASLSLLLVHREAALGRPEIRQQFGGLLAPPAPIVKLFDATDVNIKVRLKSWT